MDWVDTIIMYVMAGVIYASMDWFNHKNRKLFLKDVFITIILLATVQSIFTFIPLPQLPDVFQGMEVFIPLLVFTILLTIKGVKAAKKGKRADR